MAGYNYQAGKSNNAIEAENRDLTTTQSKQIKFNDLIKVSKITERAFDLFPHQSYNVKNFMRQKIAKLYCSNIEINDEVIKSIHTKAVNFATRKKNN